MSYFETMKKNLIKNLIIQGKKIGAGLYYMIMQSMFVRFFFKYYFLFILVFRSLFISGSRLPIFIPVIMCALIGIFSPKEFTYIEHMVFWFAYGSNLLIYDGLGEWLTSYVQKPEGLWFSTFLTVSAATNKRLIVRKVFTQAFVGLFLGKTAMTSTGRAAIITGVCAGGFLLTNSYLERLHTSAEKEKDRAHARAENERNRSHASYENDKERWHNRPWYSREKPPKKEDYNL